MTTRTSRHPLIVTLVTLFVTLLGSACGGELPEPAVPANAAEQNQPLTGPLDDNIVLVGNTVYMRKASTGDFYTYDTSTRAWRQVSGPGRQFVGSGSALYKLTPDGQAVLQYKNGAWTQIGGPAATLYAGGAGLLMTSPATGDVYQYSESGNFWQQVGGPGSFFAVGGSNYFAVPLNRDKVYQNLGAPFYWLEIGGATAFVYPGTTRMYAAGNGSGGMTGDIFRFDGRPGAWTLVGGPGRTFAMAGDTLFGLSGDGAVYMNRDGTAWTAIGGPVEWIFGGTGSLMCARISATFGTACYDVNTQQWSLLSQP